MAGKLKLSEKQVTEQTIGWLKAKGWMCLRLQSGTVRGLTGNTFIKLNQRGTPDWIIARGTTCFFLELKRSSGGVLSGDQKQWIDHATRNGMVCFVVSNFDKFLEEYNERFRDSPT